MVVGEWIFSDLPEEPQSPDTRGFWLHSRWHFSAAIRGVRLAVLKLDIVNFLDILWREISRRQFLCTVLCVDIALH